VFLPAQIVLLPDMFAVGGVETVTITVAVFVHPFALAATTE
jgi:hypothetical protein